MTDVFIVESWHGEYEDSWIELQGIFSTLDAAIAFMYEKRADTIYSLEIDNPTAERVYLGDKIDWDKIIHPELAVGVIIRVKPEWATVNWRARCRSYLEGVHHIKKRRREGYSVNVLLSTEKPEVWFHDYQVEVVA